MKGRRVMHEKIQLMLKTAIFTLSAILVTSVFVMVAKMGKAVDNFSEVSDSVNKFVQSGKITTSLNEFNETAKSVKSLVDSKKLNETLSNINGAAEGVIEVTGSEDLSGALSEARKVCRETGVIVRAIKNTTIDRSILGAITRAKLDCDRASNELEQEEEERRREQERATAPAAATTPAATTPAATPAASTTPAATPEQKPISWRDWLCFWRKKNENQQANEPTSRQANESTNQQ